MRIVVSLDPEHNHPLGVTQRAMTAIQNKKRKNNTDSTPIIKETDNELNQKRIREKQLQEIIKKKKEK